MGTYHGNVGHSDSASRGFGFSRTRVKRQQQIRAFVKSSASHTANKGKGVANHPSGGHPVKRDSKGRFSGRGK